MVAVLALARPVPAIVTAARVRLNAISARTSQAAFAVNTPGAGGEERVEPVRVEQGRLVPGLVVQLWDPPDDQPCDDVFILLPGGERGEP
jgi:hypothetical protein